MDARTPPQSQPAAVWQGQSNGEAFSSRLRERADPLDLPAVIEVQPWEQSGGCGVSVEWGDGPDQAVMYEVADCVDGCRVLDHHGEDMTVAQGARVLRGRRGWAGLPAGTGAGRPVTGLVSVPLTRPSPTEGSRYRPPYQPEVVRQFTHQTEQTGLKAVRAAHLEVLDTGVGTDGRSTLWLLTERG